MNTPKPQRVPSPGDYVDGTCMVCGRSPVNHLQGFGVPLCTVCSDIAETERKVRAIRERESIANKVRKELLSRFPALKRRAKP